MRITTSTDFLRARRRRRNWILAAGGITSSLLILLLPEWLELRWFVYPLPRVVVEILQNLFWAFTTSTIFMLFENSVNGGGSLLERYRDIDSSVSRLPGAMFSTEFMSRPSDLNEAATFDAEMLLASVEGWDGLKRFVGRWSETIDFAAYERTLNSYREHAARWQQQVARNHVVFSPGGLPDDFEEAFQKRCEQFIDAVTMFDRRGTRNGPYWVLEEDIGRGTILEFDDDAAEGTAYEELISRVEVFGDADRPLLSVVPIAPEGRFAISLNTHQLSWTYFYSAASRDEDWATPQGSRELDHRLPEASAVTEPAFWLAPPKHVLNADLL